MNKLELFRIDNPWYICVLYSIRCILYKFRFAKETRLQIYPQIYTIFAYTDQLNSSDKDNNTCKILIIILKIIKISSTIEYNYQDYRSMVTKVEVFEVKAEIHN